MTAVIHTARQHDHPSDRRYRRYRRGSQPSVTIVHTQPNYIARRLVAVLLASVMLVVAAVAVSAVAGAAVDVGGRPAAASDIESSGVPIERTHVARSGDTLWSIANAYRGDIDRSRYVDTLVDLNNGNASIQVGQTVRLP